MLGKGDFDVIEAPRDRCVSPPRNCGSRTAPYALGWAVRWPTPHLTDAQTARWTRTEHSGTGKK